jgi:hypothetical protein
MIKQFKELIKIKNTRWPFLILPLFFLIPKTGISRTSLNIGIASSSIYTTDSNSQDGLVFGVTKNWNSEKQYFISGSILLTQKSSYLKNRKIGYYLEEADYYHIDLDIQFLETIALFGYYVPNTQNILSLKIGPSIILETKDTSRITYSPNARANEEFEKIDYTWTEATSSIFANSGLGINVGLSFYPGIFEINILYTRHLFDINWIYDNRRLNLHEKLHGIKFCLGIKL